MVFGRLASLSATLFQGSGLAAMGDGLCCLKPTFTSLNYGPSISSARISTYYRGYTNSTNLGAVVSKKVSYTPLTCTVLTLGPLGDGQCYLKHHIC